MLNVVPWTEFMSSQEHQRGKLESEGKVCIYTENLEDPPETARFQLGSQVFPWSVSSSFQVLHPDGVLQPSWCGSASLLLAESFRHVGGSYLPWDRAALLPSWSFQLRKHVCVAVAWICHLTFFDSVIVVAFCCIVPLAERLIVSYQVMIRPSGHDVGFLRGQRHVSSGLADLLRQGWVLWEVMKQMTE